MLINCPPSERLFVGKRFHSACLVFGKCLQSSKSLLQTGQNRIVYGLSAKSMRDLWIVLWSHYPEEMVQIGQLDPTFSPKWSFSEKQSLHCVYQEDRQLSLFWLLFAKTNYLIKRGQGHYINSNDKVYWTASRQRMSLFHFWLNSIVLVV